MNTTHVSYLNFKELTKIFESFSISNNDNLILNVSVVGGFEESYVISCGNIIQGMINTIKQIVDPCPDLYQYDFVWMEKENGYEIRISVFL